MIILICIELIQQVTITSVFSLEVHKCQSCQLSIVWQNSITIKVRSVFAFKKDCVRHNGDVSEYFQFLVRFIAMGLTKYRCKM